MIYNVGKCVLLFLIIAIFRKVKMNSVFSFNSSFCKVYSPIFGYNLLYLDGYVNNIHFLLEK